MDIEKLKNMSDSQIRKYYLNMEAKKSWRKLFIKKEVNKNVI